jgi:negative regulator of flagellin synthesis FlgM
MKVQDNSSIGPVSRTDSDARPAATAAPPAILDKVTLPPAQVGSDSVELARSAAASGRATQLRAVEAAVRSGTYQPNPEQIANQILNEAEVDAQLRAMLMG